MNPMKKSATVDTKVCAACGVCMKACPRRAVYVWRGCYARVEEEKCIGCGLCVRACPANCITLTEKAVYR